MSRHSFDEVRTVKARKAHYCLVCGDNIQPGAYYKRFVGLWQREFQNWGAHTTCHFIAERILVEGGISEPLDWQYRAHLAAQAHRIAQFVDEFPPATDDDKHFATHLIAQKRYA